MLSIKLIAAEFKCELQQLYGDQLAGLVLFGSYARGNNQVESDVDFAVVLRDPNTRSTDEIVRLVPISTALSLKYGVIVSILPVSEKKLSASMQGVYQEIRREGILV
ncbi:nucleotidyltransferase domain-containing protein [Spirosoma taeanense]|uniref:Nucleotidyltransferase domain-containing protein n=1 Tax=Spirosoma taeanense TaxID=2735870 RepID=A0A6M5Y2M5_9BACT|nr:nucleotidyltransferase domain-containing protein [Spirosoma taeanense]QJW88049.1 nucleotidyltransferase domain-containing protein [Spirosoma taeanense]